jgi:hypothetical protein
LVVNQGDRVSVAAHAPSFYRWLTIGIVVLIALLLRAFFSYPGAVCLGIAKGPLE